MDDEGKGVSTETPSIQFPSYRRVPAYRQELPRAVLLCPHVPLGSHRLVLLLGRPSRPTQADTPDLPLEFLLHLKLLGFIAAEYDDPTHIRALENHGDETTPK